MAALDLQLHCLPAAQRRLWTELGSVPPEFVLCGGTALALMLGHRKSVDFDFFSYRAIDTRRLLSTIDFLCDAKVIQQDINTLTVEVKRGAKVRVSFFGVPKLNRIKTTRLLSEPKIKLASPIDLAGMKAAVITQRAEIKDYLDLHALFTQTSLTFLDALAAASKIYGPQFNPLLGIKALADLNAPQLIKLPAAVKSTLETIAAEIELRHLAQSIKTRKLSGPCQLSPIKPRSR